MKKLIAILIVAAYMFTIPAFAGDVLLSDVQKEELYNFGIMTGDADGDLRLNDTITRAEAIKMICIAGNINPTYPTEEKDMFDDVSSNHWAYQYVCTAKALGIVAGDENGNFKPDDNITNEEIVKIIVCLLGYDVIAEGQGGYPAGYTAQATKLRITNGMNLDTKSPAIRNDVAVMVYRALDVPILTIKPKGEDEAEGSVEYVVLNGEDGNPYSTLRSMR